MDIKQSKIVWQGCERVLKSNGKLIINTPLMLILKANLSTHYNRHIFNTKTFNFK
jgi:DNA modification methylase